MNATEILADRRSKAAELEHLRTFFLRWCEMHRRIADKAETMENRKRAAQDLTDQAELLKEFYG